MTQSLLVEIYKKSIFLKFFVLISLLLLENASAVVNDVAIQSEQLPKKLSEFGFFENPIKQIPVKNVIHYELISPLFSDYARKKRFVYVPIGKKATHRTDSVYQFPIGTALIKTFYYMDDERKEEPKVQLLETRVLLRKANGWDAASYVWDDVTKDAELKIAGKAIDSSWINTNGELMNVRYRVPNQNQCQECHESNNEIIPIGPKARNLNKKIFYPDLDAKLNQLRYWSNRGIIDAHSDSMKRVAAWNDTDMDLEERARAYLAINCGHCHSPTGNAASSGLYLNLTEDRPKQLGVLKKPVAAGRGSGDKLYSIVPGKPEDSILLYRMQSTDPGVMMPESGRALNHKEGIDLIANWIKSLN